MWEARIGSNAISPEPFVSWDWWLRQHQTRRWQVASGKVARVWDKGSPIMCKMLGSVSGNKGKAKSQTSGLTAERKYH